MACRETSTLNEIRSFSTMLTKLLSSLKSIPSSIQESRENGSRKLGNTFLTESQHVTRWYHVNSLSQCDIRSSESWEHNASLSGIAAYLNEISSTCARCLVHDDSVRFRCSVTSLTIFHVNDYFAKKDRKSLPQASSCRV